MKFHFRPAFLPLVLAASAWGVPKSRAATLVVDGASPQARDANAGTRAAPFKTVNAAAQAARAGDTVLVRPGIYREKVVLTQSGKLGAPIIFQSEVPQAAIIDGADVITDLRAEAPLGGQPIFSFAAPEMQKSPWNEWGANADIDYWVYVNGAPLELAQDVKKRGPETFWLDLEARRVFFAAGEGVDVGRQTIEFARREGLFAATPQPSNSSAPLDDIHIRGFRLRHCANWFQGLAPIQIRGRRWLVEGNRIEWASWRGIWLKSSRDCIIRNNVVDWSGDEAIIGESTFNLLVEGNTFTHGNWRRINPDFTGGASKFAYNIQTRLLNNEVAYNFGYGLWFDIHNVGNILQGNTVHDTLRGAGLFSEISNDQTFSGNVAYNNNIGISIAESPGCVAQHNIAFNNNTGVQIRGNYTRDNDSKDKSSNYSPGEKGFADSIDSIPDLDPAVRDNYLAKYLLYWRAPRSFLSNNSLLWQNLIFDNRSNVHEERNYNVPSPLDAFVNNFSDGNIFFPDGRLSFPGGAYESLAAWQRASGRDGTSQIFDPRALPDKLPDWAKLKAALWSQKMRSPQQMGELGLGLVDSPSAAQVGAWLSRSAKVTPVAMSDAGVKAFLFERDGQRGLALWTTQAGERRAVRVRTDAASVTLENTWGTQSKPSLQNGALRLTATYLPQTIWNVGANVGAAPDTTLRAQSFALPDQALTATATFLNDGRAPLQIRARFEAPGGFTVTPAQIERTVAPGKSDVVKLRLTPDGSVRRGVSTVRMTAQAGGETLVRSSQFAIGEGGARLSRAAKPIAIDGSLSEWPASTSLGVITDAEQIANGERASWSGPADASAKIFAAWTPEALYAAVEVTDDVVISAPGANPWEFDAIEFFVDGRAVAMQWQKEPSAGVFQIGVSPPARDGDKPTVQVLAATPLAGLEAASRRTAKGYVVEVKIPLSPANFPAREFEAGRMVKMSVILDDKDALASTARDNALGWSFSPNGANFNDTSGWKALSLG